MPTACVMFNQQKL